MESPVAAGGPAAVGGVATPATAVDERFEYLEQLLADSAEQQSALKDRTEYVEQLNAQSTVVERMDYVEKLLADSAGKHAQLEQRVAEQRSASEGSFEYGAQLLAQSVDSQAEARKASEEAQHERIGKHAAVIERIDNVENISIQWLISVSST